MTLDEAIKHCLEVAEQNETQADKIGRQFIGSAMDKYATDCRECAADRRQLAEWLTDYEGLRAEIIDLRLYVQMLEEYREKAKRLLKAAVEDFAVYGALKDLSSEQRVQNPDWRRFNRVFDVLDHQWRYADEALKLIES